MIDGTDTQQSTQDVVLITGPSGAGRTTALKVLEDIGYESIDNLPMSMLPSLFQRAANPQSLALGIDPRNRDFSPSEFGAMVEELTSNPAISLTILYLDCSVDVLIKRFSETRRRHPLAPNETPAIGIERELALLDHVRSHAGALIDTTTLSPHDLRDELVTLFAREKAGTLAISLQSFSYKRGVPRGADMVFDCRFLRNPYWSEVLRTLTGQDKEVCAYIENDPTFQPFLEKVTGLLTFLLPAYVGEGKAHLCIAFGCTGGQHRSVAVAESVSKALADSDWRVSIRHRELERWAGNTPKALSKVGFV
ncbi:UNVERIFIED_CONTAM: hypothetical protein GTU68_020435 [Idotea baltica]|nr:hypothetical protein [Idotea baltica]